MKFLAYALPLLLLSNSSQASHATLTSSRPSSAAYWSSLAPLSTGLTGYMWVGEMIPSFNGVNNVINRSNYIRFSYGPNAPAEAVSITVVSANCDPILVTGFDDAMNVWRLDMNTDVVPYDSPATVTIQVTDQYLNTSEYIINLPREAWY